MYPALSLFAILVGSLPCSAVAVDRARHLRLTKVKEIAALLAGVTHRVRIEDAKEQVLYKQVQQYCDARRLGGPPESENLDQHELNKFSPEVRNRASIAQMDSSLASGVLVRDSSGAVEEDTEVVDTSRTESDAAVPQAVLTEAASEQGAAGNSAAAQAAEEQATVEKAETDEAASEQAAEGKAAAPQAAAEEQATVEKAETEEVAIEQAAEGKAAAPQAAAEEQATVKKAETEEVAIEQAAIDKVTAGKAAARHAAAEEKATNDKAAAEEAASSTDKAAAEQAAEEEKAADEKAVTEEAASGKASADSAAAEQAAEEEKAADDKAASDQLKEMREMPMNHLIEQAASAAKKAIPEQAVAEEKETVDKAVARKAVVNKPLKQDLKDYAKMNIAKMSLPVQKEAPEATSKDDDPVVKESVALESVIAATENNLKKEANQEEAVVKEQLKEDLKDYAKTDNANDKLATEGDSASDGDIVDAQQIPNVEKEAREIYGEFGSEDVDSFSVPKSFLQVQQSHDNEQSIVVPVADLDAAWNALKKIAEETRQSMSMIESLRKRGSAHAAVASAISPASRSHVSGLLQSADDAIHDECNWLLNSFEKRQQMRWKEAAMLKEAKALLASARAPAIHLRGAR